MTSMPNASAEAGGSGRGDDDQGSGGQGDAARADLARVLGAIDPIVSAGPPSEADAAPLAALDSLHRLRTLLTEWEPLLIERARAEGASWARLATVLGVSSRQAAERRYLRLRTDGEPELTREQRVQATRDERAGDRAVAVWAREHAAELRQIAGAVSSAPGLSRSARRRASTLAGELTRDDPATLIAPLADMHGDLVEDHAHLAAEVSRIDQRVGALRRETRRRRDRGQRR
jgi:hypothetical protein